MGIAIPRPAMRAREDRIIRLKLQWHTLRTGELMAQGMSQADASRAAMRDSVVCNFVALDNTRQRFERSRKQAAQGVVMASAEFERMKAKGVV